jgi:hypothetical protein
MRIVLYFTIKANHVHLPCMQAYSLCAFIRCTFGISTHAPHHTGLQTESPVVVLEEPEKQLEVQPQEVTEADE